MKAQTSWGSTASKNWNLPFVINRDIKAENVLIFPNGVAKLTDFGLCQLNATLDKKMEEPMGSLYYIAPEMVLHQPYTRSVDWWAFGILIFFMLTDEVRMHSFVSLGLP
jgi:serine/threonine protein kinase